MANPLYATRAAVRGCLESPLSSRLNRVIDESLAAATRDIDAACGFPLYDGDDGGAMAPKTGTRYFDWPTSSTAGTPGWRLWLGGHRLLDLTALVSGSRSIDVDDVLLRPDGRPPYRYVELSLSGASALGLGAGLTWQRSTALTGEWGESATLISVGTLVGSITTGSTVVLSDSSTVSVGSLLVIGSERIIVTDQSLVDTGINVSGAIATGAGVTSVPVDDGTGIHAGETVTIGAERMYVLDVSGNTLIVRRGVEGSVVTAHSNADAVLAPRSFTVARGTRGTSSASHANGATVSAWVPPSLAREWCEGLAINAVLQKLSGYVRTVGSGDYVRNASGAGLDALALRALRAHGRQMRTAAI